MCYLDGMPEAYDRDLRTQKYWEKRQKEATAAAIKAAQLRRAEKEVDNDRTT